MRYVAIDFETANNDPISACSVGLAKMENGRVVDSYYTLINPPSSYFSPMNISIHGIRPEQVADAPTFETVWPDMLMFIGDDLLIAHNAPFDIGILRAMLNWYGLPIPSIRYTCTVRISRKVWPELPSHKLTDLSRHFGFDYQAHHALEDAVNCALVFHKACPCPTETEAVEYLMEKGIRFQRMTGGLAPLEPPPQQGGFLL
ncbi:MAG: 3'-5' exonuclease [Sphaerochaeta sp.]|nr:3'-5' exonuclease [Sphaerochaeta sp.]